MPDDPAQYYNLFSEWREHELRECVLFWNSTPPERIVSLTPSHSRRQVPERARAAQRAEKHAR